MQYQLLKQKQEIIKQERPMLTNLHYEPLVKLVTQPLKSPCLHHYYYHLKRTTMSN